VQTATTVFFDNLCNISVVGSTITENGDHDNFVDSNETATMQLQLVNNCGIPLTNCIARISSTTPEVACIIDGLINIPSIPNNATTILTTADAFQWKAAGFNQSSATAPTQWKFSITMTCDEMASLENPQSVSGPFDLDIAFNGADLTMWTEGFETNSGLAGTKFTAQNNDAGLPGNSDPEGLANSNGWRCQYADPDWPNSGSFGSDQAATCYPAYTLTQSNAVFWQIDGPAPYTSPDGGRAKVGTRSLYYGKYITTPAVTFTTPLAVVEGVATTAPINLGPGPTGPILSFWQQISLMDNRGINSRVGRAADRGVLEYRLADQTTGTAIGDWIRLEPFQNGYDLQAEDNYFACTFDPIDDGNDEDDFFDPTDPNRRNGPSSTCYTTTIYACQGDTDAVAFNTQSVCNATTAPAASDDPALTGDGFGTWVQSKVDLNPLRGRRIRLRYLVSAFKADEEDWELQFKFNPDPRDDGWWIDDVLVSQSLVNPATFVVDSKNNTTLAACGNTCNTVTARVQVNGGTPDGAINPGTVSLSAPGQVVELNAAALVNPSTADRCLSGSLQFRFTRDGTLLRNWLENPILVDAPVPIPPATSVTYAVGVRCSTLTTCNDTENVIVEVDCPSTGVLHGFPTIFADPSSTSFSWTLDSPWHGVTDRSPQVPAAWVVRRGLLSDLTAGNYTSSQIASGTGTSFTDTTAAPAGDGWYWVVGRTDAQLCNESPASWSACPDGPDVGTDPDCAEQPGRDGGFPILP
jgi:hypothetical protein